MRRWVELLKKTTTTTTSSKRRKAAADDGVAPQTATKIKKTVNKK